MHVCRSVLQCIPSVSALVFNPNLLLISPSTTNPGNVSTVSKTFRGPWHTSIVSEVAPISMNVTNSSTVRVNRQIEWRCNEILGSGPYATSCDDAIHHIAFTPPGSDDSHEFRWGKREWPLFRDVPLPQEVVSCKHLMPVLRLSITF